MVAHALRSSLIDDARAAALDCAADRLAAGTPASEILAPDEIAAGCELQIIAADGSVSAPEDSGLPAPPLIAPPADDEPATAVLDGTGGRADGRDGGEPGDADGAVPRVVAAQATRTPAGRMTAVVAVLVRLAVHRALRPVVRISDDVAAITDAGEDRRVRVPAADDEIAHLARTMNGTLERLARSDAARKRFIADASHELRSPVATLQIHVETAPPGPAGPQGAPGSPGAPAAPGATALIDREVVSGEVRRLAGLVEDLLTAAKGDAGGLELRMADCDLDDVVLAEVRRLRAVTHHEVRLRLDAAQVRGDAGRLAQVLRNLLDNANRHSRGWIAVTVEPTSQGGADIVRVHVDNEGPALPPELRERVFERFARLDESRSRDRGGSGLGLAIARMLAGAHGGTLVAGESPEGCFRMTLTLPRIDGEQAPPAVPTHPTGAMP